MFDRSKCDLCGDCLVECLWARNPFLHDLPPGYSLDKGFDFPVLLVM
jgi:hypothetical protein